MKKITPLKLSTAQGLFLYCFLQPTDQNSKYLQFAIKKVKWKIKKGTVKEKLFSKSSINFTMSKSFIIETPRHHLHSEATDAISLTICVGALKLTFHVPTSRIP